MTPTINDNLIGSDRTAHTISPSTGHQHALEVSRPAAGPHKNSGRQPNPPPAREAVGP